MSLPIEVRHLAKSFGTVTALDDVSLSLAPGSFTAVVGASGSGKSTLLRVLGGLEEPSAGEVTLGRQSPNAVRAAKEVGWMAQQPALLPWRTVHENVALAQTLNPRPDRPVLSVERLLAVVGLDEFGASRPGELSGGMQQRVALARTLAIGASVWLMDEPFSALDELTRETLADDLLGIWETFRTTVVWVTHHIPEAVKLADTVVLLTPRPGRVAEVIEIGLDRPRPERSADFQDLVARARAVLRHADRPAVGRPA